MKNLFFWNKYPQAEKWTYLLLLWVFLLSIVWSIYAYFSGLETVVNWQTNSTVESIPLSLDYFSRGLFTMKVEVENMIIKDAFQASELNVNLWASNIYFLFLIIAYIVGLSIITELPKIWYFVGMLAFIFALANMNIELLQLFHQKNKYPVFGIIALYAMLSYYFFAFNKSASLITRIIAISGLTLLISMVIYWQSSTLLPVLVISNLGISVPCIIALVFFIIVSKDLILLFLNLTANNKTNIDKRRLLNFVIISSLYLLNLGLLVFKKLGLLNWDILYLNMFILIISSSIAGIWGYKKRNELNHDILPFRPLGALLYLCYGIITFSTIGYAYITANQPLVDAIEYFILISHSAFGFLFFVYIMVNFGFLFRQNISIYQIVFVPRRFPFFMVHTGGGLLALSIIFKLNMYPYLLAVSGFMNSTGDYYHAIKDDFLAKEYYFNGLGYARYNQRSNYCLATLYEKDGKNKEAQEFYGALLGKNTSPQTYINLSNWYLKNDMLLQAMFTLQEGLLKHPNNGYIANNLGLLFSNTDVSDSVYFYLQSAKSVLPNSAVPKNNLLFQLLKENSFQLADSVLNTSPFLNDLKSATNELAIKNLLKNTTNLKNIEINALDSIHLFQQTYLINQQINEIITRTISSNSIIDTILKYEANAYYFNGLNLVKALKKYYSGAKMEGIEALESLYSSSTNPQFAKILAIWYYEQEMYLKSYEYFKNTIEKEGQTAVLHCSMALCEAGQYQEAKENLNQLSLSKAPEIASIAKSLIKIFETKQLEEVKSWNQASKYQFIHFRKKEFDKATLLELAQAMDTVFYQNIAKAELIELNLLLGDNQSASKIWSSIKNIPAENTFEKGFLNEVQLKLWGAQKEWQKIAQNISSIYLNSDKENLRKYWQAKANEGLGKTTLVSQQYLAALSHAGFNEQVVIDVANFFAKNGKTTFAYEIVAKAIKQNNNNIQLLKTYIEYAGELEFESYVQDAFAQITPLMSKAELSTYKNYIETKFKFSLQ